MPTPPPVIGPQPPPPRGSGSIPIVRGGVVDTFTDKITASAMDVARAKQGAAALRLIEQLPPLPPTDPLPVPKPLPQPQIPRGFVAPPPPRTFNVPEPNLTEATKTDIGLQGTEAFLVKTTAGFLIERAHNLLFPSIPGVDKPPGALEKLKLAKLTLRAPGAAPLTAEERAVRADLLIRVIKFTLAGAIGGEILAGSEAAAGEERSIQAQEQLERIGRELALKQLTPLTPVEVATIKEQLGDSLEVADLVRGFNEASAENLKAFAAQNALALLNAGPTPFVPFLADATNPRTGFVTTWPMERADP